MRRNEPGKLILAAQGHTLHVRSFALNGDRLEPARLTPETLELNGQKVAGWRAAPDVAWLTCLVELLPDGAMPPTSDLRGAVSERWVTLSESGGLVLKLARRHSGELVEIYDQDWRTLPLLESPAHRLCPGDLAANAASVLDSHGKGQA